MLMHYYNYSTDKIQSIAKFEWVTDLFQFHNKNVHTTLSTSAEQGASTCIQKYSTFEVVQSLISTVVVDHLNHVLWNKSHVTLHPENLKH